MAYLVRAPLRRPRLVLAPTLLMALAALLVAQLSPARYRAHALLRAEWDTSNDALLKQRGLDVEDRRVGDVRQRVVGAASIDRLLRDPGPGAPERIPDRAELERWLRGVSVAPEGPMHVRIECVDGDASRAAWLANRLAAGLVAESGGDPAQLAEATRAVEDRRAALEAAKRARGSKARPARAGKPPSAPTDDELGRLQAEYDQALSSYRERLEQWSAAEAASGARRGPHSRFEIVRGANPPAQAEPRGVVLWLLAGALLGLASGIAGAVVVERRDHSVKGPEDLAGILPVPLLALLPEARERDAGD
jgi:hypothetical protein